MFIVEAYFWYFLDSVFGSFQKGPHSFGSFQKGPHSRY